MIINGKKTLYIILFAVIFVFIFGSLIGRKYIYHDVYADSLEEAYTSVAQLCMQHKERLRITYKGEGSEFDMDAVEEKMKQIDPFKGLCIKYYRYTYVQNGEEAKININIQYFFDASKLKRVDKRSKAIADKLEGMSDYEKVKAVHDYLCIYNEYAYDGLVSLSIGHGPYWALYPGYVVCNGYALSFYRIMQYCNIPVTYETGDSHAWNTVYVDGNWYNIDLTWDDARGDNVSYDYFLKNDADFFGHHHGGSDATKSLEVVGNSAIENYELFPNYKRLFWLETILELCVPFAVIIFIFRFRRKKKEKARKIWAENQKRLREQEELENQMLMSLRTNRENSITLRK